MDELKIRLSTLTQQEIIHPQLINFPNENFNFIFYSNFILLHYRNTTVFLENISELRRILLEHWEEFILQMEQHNDSFLLKAATITKVWYRLTSYFFLTSIFPVVQHLLYNSIPIKFNLIPYKVIIIKSFPKTCFLI